MENTNHTNLVNKRNSGETSKQRERLLTSSMLSLAAALGVEITGERIILYLRPLADLTDAQLQRGFDLALREYKPSYSGSFPAPAELREYATREPVDRTAAETQAILRRPAKPDDWVPLDQLKREMQGVCEFPSGRNVPVEDQERRLAELRRQADVLKGKP